jgi:DNA-binding phage protein
MSVEELDRALNGGGAPRFSTSARLGEGVMQTLDACAHAVHAKAQLSRGVYR